MVLTITYWTNWKYALTLDSKLTGIAIINDTVQWLVKMLFNLKKSVQIYTGLHKTIVEIYFPYLLSIIMLKIQ